MATASLCRLCSNPETCALCELIRRPRPLSTREIARFGLTSHPASVESINAARIAELQRQIEAERALNLRLRARLADAAPKTPRPTPTAPMAAPVKLAPAPLPLPRPVGELQRGDWVGLAARVESGELTQAQAEQIGMSWAKGGDQAHAMA